MLGFLPASVTAIEWNLLINFQMQPHVLPPQSQTSHHWDAVRTRQESVCVYVIQTAVTELDYSLILL